MQTVRLGRDTGAGVDHGEAHRGGDAGEGLGRGALPGGGLPAQPGELGRLDGGGRGPRAKRVRARGGRASVVVCMRS